MVLLPEALQSRHVWALRLALPVLLSVLGCGIAGLSILIGTLRAFGLGTPPTHHLPLPPLKICSLSMQIMSKNPH